MSAAAFELAQIETMERQEVESLWRKKLPKVPMPNLQLRSLRRALVYELQVKRSGDVDRQTAFVLKQALANRRAVAPTGQIAEEDTKLQASSAGAPAGAEQAAIPQLSPILKSGTVLVRTWNGRRYQVKVLDKGFEMDGRVYKSLSQMARTITSAHWSGPRFFGLVKAPANKRAGAREGA